MAFLGARVGKAKDREQEMELEWNWQDGPLPQSSSDERLQISVEMSEPLQSLPEEGLEEQQAYAYEVLGYMMDVDDGDTEVKGKGRK